jgi:hypothetical protein
LVAAVGVASRHPLTGGRTIHGSTGGGFSWIVDVITGAMVVAVGMGLIVWVSALRPAHRRGAVSRSRGRNIWGLLFLAALLFVELRYHLIKFHRSASARSGLVPSGTSSSHPGHLPAAAGSHLPWPVLIALAIAGLVAGVAIVGGYRRGSPGTEFPAGTEDEEAAVVARVVADIAWTALDDLAQEADPRRAVVAAYARMERGLRQAGIRRAPADTPTEYLTRAFARLPAGRPEAARLTELYEEARFSDHTVAEAMRADAIAALGALARVLDAWHRALTKTGTA